MMLAIYGPTSRMIILYPTFLTLRMIILALFYETNHYQLEISWI